MQILSLNDEVTPWSTRAMFHAGDTLWRIEEINKINFYGIVCK